MKKIYFILFLSIFAMAVTSCDNRPKVFGSWQGQMQSNIAGDQSMLTVTYDFQRDGAIYATYFLTVQMPVQEVDSMISPFLASMSATANVKGTWQYVQHEDDEIAIAFDPSTIDIQVDPESVEYSANVFTDQQDPHLVALKPALMETVKNKFYADIFNNRLNSLLDDVEVKSPVLKFEEDHIEYVFHSTDLATK